MPSRKYPVHVATTKRIYKGKTYRSHLLRRTYREGGKVKHQTLGNISHLPDPVVDLVRRALKGETLVAADQAFSCERSLPHGHVAAVLGTLRKLRLDSLIARAPSRNRDLVTALIVARVIDARSKLATARALSSETAASSLGHALGLGDVSQHELYDAMDWLLRRQPGIETRLARKHLHENTLVLYDLSSTWLEGTHCPLAQLGYSRDRKKGKLQIVFGLLCSRDGCPIAVEVFEGATSDPRTVASQVDKLRNRFGLSRVVVVGDRGMLTSARIREDLAPVEGLRWITSLRAPDIRKLIAARVVNPSLFDERDLAEIRSDDFPGERLVVCRNPRLAAKRRKKRQELLAATEKLLAPIALATTRKSRPLRGKDAIGIRVGKVINRHKVAKHFHIEITDDSFSFHRLEAQIAGEEQLDGLYVIRSNVEPEDFDAEETVRAYKDLGKVEHAFRSFKSVDLKVRPIHHRKPERVRAHVLLCMLAYYVEWHMRRPLAPILYDDHEPEVAASLRTSVVAPAQRSPAARNKAARKRTPDNLPTHDFRSLLAELGTFTANWMRLAGAQESFILHPTPTAVQDYTFEALAINQRL